MPYKIGISPRINSTMIDELRFKSAAKALRAAVDLQQIGEVIRFIYDSLDQPIELEELRVLAERG